MIRREDLASDGAAPLVREAITALVNDRTPMVIVGLGTLSRRTYPHDTHIGYRLTLTAAVEDDETDRHSPGPILSVGLARDVRHLAVAIGEQVEVWAPGPDGQPAVAVKPR